jgi:hypothetical protein
VCRRLLGFLCRCPLASQTWLDKLGAAARLNVSVVCRQAWMGGQYSLIQYRLRVIRKKRSPQAMAMAARAMAAGIMI